MTDTLTITQIGMLNDVERLRVISNNLANVNTVGFKADIPYTRVFAQELSAQLDPSKPSGVSGYSRPVFSTAMNSDSGSMKFTGNPLDIALAEQLYFVVHTDQGERLTRQGTFQLDHNGRLVTAGGHLVLGDGGEVRLSHAHPRIDENGVIWEGAAQVAKLRVVKVEQGAPLLRQGDGLFTASEAVALNETHEGRLRQGYVETANVIPMKEMVQMIETVRHFETSQRVLRGYDTMLDRAINVLGETR